ncbi:MAG: hypothetical protein B7Z15_23565 [Rhizobiales bacterium 32-66-8]|nr:MAG: hypothetical protein B7Z45_03045 [Azorhizobium sp. 12-66-6]OYW97181.1 MAG: hypothetical protein B7Z15_23565 [Rhizobiales bacterium 32-66-8]
MAGLWAASPAFSASLGSASSALAGGAPAHVVQVGGWGPGWGPGPRPYYPPPRGCWNCNNNNGAAVGAGIALGILGAAAIAGAASAPPPPPVYYAPAPPPAVYYAPPPPNYGPPPVTYVPAGPPPGQCWFPTDTRGNGYFAPC